MSLPAPVVTGLAFLVALGVLVFVHELGHFAVAKRLGVKVLRFSIGFGPILFARRRGETEYAISAMPLGGYVKMLGEEDSEEELAEVELQPERAFSTQPLPRRSAIVFAGPAMNFLFAFLAYLALFVAVGAEHPSDQPRVGGVSQGSPAERGGLQAGDRVLEVDGTQVATWEQLAQTVRQSDGHTLHLVVDREGQRLPLEVTPELKPAPNLYGEETKEAYLIGIAASQEWERVGPLEAVPLAAKQTVSASFVVVQGLALMVQGRVPLKELGGPIAIASAAGQQARAGARYFVSLLAFLSINLGILNLLPIPALDGGHLALFGIEAVLGRPLRRRHREIAQQVGILLLLSLMVFVFYNDINRLVRG
jgi:regulator of sigma E protease